MKCMSRNVWGLEKYIMIEVFDLNGQSVGIQQNRHIIPFWALARGGGGSRVEKPVLYQLPVKEERRNKALWRYISTWCQPEDMV